jgi:hypothetical protein
MARVLLALFILCIVGGTVIWLAKTLTDSAKQRKLYCHNPELSDLPRPVVNKLVEQKQQLETARHIMQGMLNDPINVFLPDPHQTRVQQWLDANTKEISK